MRALLNKISVQKIKTIITNQIKRACMSAGFCCMAENPPGPCCCSSLELIVTMTKITMLTRTIIMMVMKKKMMMMMITIHTPPLSCYREAWPQVQRRKLASGNPA